MNPRLIDHPVLPPFRCFACTHSAAEHGPYLHTGIEAASGSQVEAVCFCASCTATLMRAVDVAPVARLTEALGFKSQAEEATRLASEFHGEIEAQAQTILRLEGQLEGAHSQIASLQRTVEEKQRTAASDRKEALLAAVAKQTKPTKEKTAA